MSIVNKQSASEQIVDYILTQIEQRKLLPGDKLMNERDFAEMLGVSRVPLREAIRSLCILGILKSKQGDGTFVNSYDPEILSRTIYTYTILDNTPYMEIMEMRKIMEAESAKMACENATAADIETIYAAMNERDEELKNYITTFQKQMGVFEYDKHFHRAIANATHNSFFIQFLDAIRKSLRETHVKELKDPNLMRSASMSHHKIYDAIKNRNGALAYQLMYEHIDTVKSGVSKIIEEEMAHSQ